MQLEARVLLLETGLAVPSLRPQAEMLSLEIANSFFLALGLTLTPVLSDDAVQSVFRTRLTLRVPAFCCVVWSCADSPRGGTDRGMLNTVEAQTHLTYLRPGMSSYLSPLSSCCKT